MKYILFYLLFLPYFSLANCSDLLTRFNSLHIPNTVITKIKRAGNYQERSSSIDGQIQGYFEVELDVLKSIHPIPNPHREDSKKNLALLKKEILKNGFNLNHTIQVAIMPNGLYRIIGGHHRVFIMKSLKERTIPAQVFIWSQLEPEIRSGYKELFFDPYSKLYPENFRDMLESPSSYD